MEQTQSDKKTAKVEVNAAGNLIYMETASVTGCSIWERTENNFCMTTQAHFAVEPQILM